jgi:hypothetical protein
MNPETDSLDQADEEILASTVSDEALEAAAGIRPNGTATSHRFCAGGRS